MFWKIIRSKIISKLVKQNEENLFNHKTQDLTYQILKHITLEPQSYLSQSLIIWSYSDL